MKEYKKNIISKLTREEGLEALELMVLSTTDHLDDLIGKHRMALEYSGGCSADIIQTWKNVLAYLVLARGEFK